MLFLQNNIYEGFVSARNHQNIFHIRDETSGMVEGILAERIPISTMISNWQHHPHTAI